MVRNLFFQDMRGIAILAVVLIHATGSGVAFKSIDIFQYNYTVIFRQLINFAVPVFFFISGYFVNQSSAIENSKSFKLKKIKRILIPFLIWSFVGLILRRFYNFNISSIIINLLTGQAGGIYYYLIVLAQLILITPLILNWMENVKYQKLLWFITPISLIILYILNIYIKEIVFPWNAITFPIWFIFYFYGLYLNKNSEKIKINLVNNKYTVIGLYVLSIVISIIEGFVLNKIFLLESFSLSQIKLSSYFMSFMVINLLLIFSFNNKKSNGMLRYLGDNSFGIYLIHMFIMPILQKILSICGLYNIQLIYQILVAIITIVISIIFINIVKVFIGKERSSKYLGF